LLAGGRKTLSPRKEEELGPRREGRPATKGRKERNIPVGNEAKKKAPSVPDAELAKLPLMIRTR